METLSRAVPGSNLYFCSIEDTFPYHSQNDVFEVQTWRPVGFFMWQSHTAVFQVPKWCHKKTDHCKLSAFNRDYPSDSFTFCDHYESFHPPSNRQDDAPILLYNIYWVSFVYQTWYQTLGMPRGSRPSTYLQRTPSFPKGNSYLLGVKEFWPFGNFSQLGQCFSTWIVHVNPPKILLKSRF